MVGAPIMPVRELCLKILDSLSEIKLHGHEEPGPFTYVSLYRRPP